MPIVGYQLHIWTALVRGSCYRSPGASFIGLPVLVPWLVLLPSGILRTADRNRYFLASPSGRQERRGIRHSPLYFSEQNDWFYHWVSWFTAEADSNAWISCRSLQWLFLPGIQGSLKGFVCTAFWQGSLWEGELSAAKGWQGKFSLAAHLNWVCWCPPWAKTSNFDLVSMPICWSWIYPAMGTVSTNERNSLWA